MKQGANSSEAQVDEPEKVHRNVPADIPRKTQKEGKKQLSKLKDYQNYQDYALQEDEDSLMNGVVESWSLGVVESWSLGVLESWSLGVVKSWSREVGES